MNRERAKELAPIVKAFGEGKDIQSKYPDENDSCWFDTPEPDFIVDENGISLDYRIKPEPEVIYVNCLQNNIEVFKYPTRTEAIDAACATWNYNYIAKKFIEVIE